MDRAKKEGSSVLDEGVVGEGVDELVALQPGEG